MTRLHLKARSAVLATLSKATPGRNGKLIKPKAVASPEDEYDIEDYLEDEDDEDNPVYDEGAWSSFIKQYGKKVKTLAADFPMMLADRDCALALHRFFSTLDTQLLEWTDEAFGSSERTLDKALAALKVAKKQGVKPAELTAILERLFGLFNKAVAKPTGHNVGLEDVMTNIIYLLRTRARNL